VEIIDQIISDNDPISLIRAFRHYILKLGKASKNELGIMKNYIKENNKKDNDIKDRINILKVNDPIVLSEDKVKSDLFKSIKTFNKISKKTDYQKLINDSSNQFYAHINEEFHNKYISENNLDNIDLFRLKIQNNYYFSKKLLLDDIDNMFMNIRKKFDIQIKDNNKKEKKLNKSKTKEDKSFEEKSIIEKNNNSIGYTAVTAESENNSQIQSSQVISPMGNLFGKKNKNKKIEIKKKFPDKEKREKELNLMVSALNNIGNSISSENIGNYFDRYKDFQGTEISQQRHNYFNGMGKANKLMTEIQEILHYKDADDDANVKKRMVTTESDALVEKLGILKKSAINEIEAFEKKENRLIQQK
jgi:hypothetical protein